MLTALNIVLLLLNAAFLAVGIYLSSYLKTKAEHLATREDFEELRRQTGLLTQTTKEIETEISGKMWNRQKHWELKRDVLFELTKKSGDLRDIFTRYHSVRATNNANKPISGERMQKQLDMGATFLNISAAFDSAAMFVGVVCEKAVYVSALMFASHAKEVFLELQGNEAVPYDKLLETFSEKYSVLHDDIRKELGLIVLKKATPQSTPTPAGQNPATK
jgi:hypothetical protein